MPLPFPGPSGRQTLSLHCHQAARSLFPKSFTRHLQKCQPVATQQHVPAALTAGLSRNTLQTLGATLRRRGPAAAFGAVAVLSATVAAAHAASNSWSVYRVRGDGNCMFRALAQGHHCSRNKCLLSPADEDAAAAKMRSSVCDQLQACRGDIEAFIEGEFDSYVARMRKPHVWGGEPELAVAHHVVQQPIDVYSAGGPRGLQLVSRYGEEHKGQPPISLLFHSLGHYDLLVPGSVREP